MKINHYIHFLLVTTLILSGCAPVNTTIIPTQDVTQSSLPTFNQPTVMPMPILTATKSATLTPPATLEPEQAKKIIGNLLQEPIDCEAPCFLGIMPEKTTLGDAMNILVNFGLHPEKTNMQDNKDFYEINYDFTSGLSISALLTEQNSIVKNMTINIHPEKKKSEDQREWLAYSPETLIAKYGLPSRVNFIVDRGPRPAYTMDLYFDSANLIVGYSSYDLGPKWEVCPLINQIDYVRIWMGSDPQSPPPVDISTIPLEQATSLTMEEFSKLMTVNPHKACFNLRPEMFP